MIQDHSDHGASEKLINPIWAMIPWFLSLMHHGPSDLGPLILIWIIPNEHTLSFTVLAGTTGLSVSV